VCDEQDTLLGDRWSACVDHADRTGPREGQGLVGKRKSDVVLAAG
jgi:hypothetical protein